MEKKEYNGLAVEVILLGTDSIETGLVPESRCYLGAVQYYTEDGNGNPMPLGVCWIRENNTYSLDWAEYTGDFYP